MAMRSFSKLHGCAASVILLSIYFVYHQRSHDIEGTSQRSWPGIRIVVFGDEWSDSGTLPEDGERWTETLCKELACDRVDTFARSNSPVSESTNAGTTVDMVIHPTTATANKPGKMRFDFKAQVQHFFDLNPSMQDPQSLHLPNGQTIFTVYFGLWDLLEYTTLDLKSAMDKINISVTEIFHQLDLLTTHSLSPIQVVLPRMLDVTYLPGYQSLANQTGERFAEMQQKGIYLFTYWNAVLSRSASRWERGAIFMPDPSDAVLDLLRVEQLSSHRDTDAPEPVKHMPPSEHVGPTCLIASSGGSSTGHLKAANVEACSSIVSQLFRDGTHLGVIAHRLIGKQAASLIRSDTTVNRVGASEDSTSEYIPEEFDPSRFDMNYPPGY